MALKCSRMARKRALYPDWDNYGRDDRPAEQRGPEEPPAPTNQCRVCHRSKHQYELTCCSICRNWCCFEHQRSWDHPCREWYLERCHPNTAEEWQTKFDAIRNKRRR